MSSSNFVGFFWPKTKFLKAKMGKQIHQLTLTKENTNQKFGFRIIGGKDEGQTFKVRLLSLNFKTKPFIIHE
jgi:hypothetical protein